MLLVRWEVIRSGEESALGGDMGWGRVPWEVHVIRAANLGSRGKLSAGLSGIGHGKAFLCTLQQRLKVQIWRGRE